jgi:hypothetical protein
MRGNDVLGKSVREIVAPQVHHLIAGVRLAAHANDERLAVRTATIILVNLATSAQYPVRL